MDLQYYPPRADLREYVRAYYVFSTREAAVQPLCAELGNIRILLSGGGRLHMPDGAVSQISTAFLIGPTMGAYRMEANSGSRVFGIGIRPKGWVAMLGVDAEEASDRVVDLTAFSGGAARVAIEEIKNAGAMPEMAAAADRYFAFLLDQRARKRCVYPEALAHWLLDPDDLDIDRLIEMMDVSRRQTDRLAKRFFGASPKRLQRKYRALRAADRFRAGERDWIAAAGLSFYDQSHFIKEFKKFIGVTPRQFIDNQAALIAEIQSRRRIETLGGSLASL